jgi:hypothetical protein
MKTPILPAARCGIVWSFTPPAVFGAEASATGVPLDLLGFVNQAIAAGVFREGLEVAVDGRYAFGRFESFKPPERFHDGQKSNFGITHQTPQELGFAA